MARSNAARQAAYETSGPAQLAAQPAKPRTKQVVVNQAWASLRQHSEARMTMMRAYRTSWMLHWALLESYILPRRGIFINTAQPVPNQTTRGAPINQSILDPTGTQAMRLCAAGMMGGLMSPGRPWFKLKPVMAPRDAYGQDVESWFEDVEDRMYQVMARSNFYDSGAQMFEDLVTFGTAPVIIYEDMKDIIRCYNPCPGEYFAASSNAFRVETLYRQFVMTTSQIVEMFGLKNCPRDVQELWRTKGSSLEVERIVAHAIEPNYPIQRFDDDTIGVVPGDFTYREIYWVWGTASEDPLSIRGFKDPPFICPRWAVTSNDPYGRSAGMDALPDIMQLQVETARKAEAIEKMVRPPMVASIDMKNEPSSQLPGHITYAADIGPNRGFRPAYTVNPQTTEMMNDLKEIQERIRRGFFNDLFLMLEQSSNDRMTAYEVAQRQLEKLQVLGPVVERFQNEAASPAIKRIFKIMERKQLLPPLPQALRGVQLGIEYTSLMSLAQKAAATTTLERFAQIAGNLGAVYPEAKFKLNPTEFMNEYADMTGVPKRVLNTDDQVKAMMDQMAQQQQQAQAAQTGMAAVQGAQVLSQTDVGGGQNALQAMLGTAPAAGTA